jgi:hypothetical protein
MTAADRGRARRWAATAAGVCVLLALGVLAYHDLVRGPGRAFVRGALGDVIVVAFLYFALGALTRWRPRARLLAVAGVALATELSQLVPRGARSAAIDLTIGATFDPLDLLCYGAGLALAWALERQALRGVGAPGAPRRASRRPGAASHQRDG